jgi:hypothetical protein
VVLLGQKLKLLRRRNHLKKSIKIEPWVGLAKIRDL